jgi:prepilin-type N-terminal cleavage/methylation domain-containing protein
MTGPPFRRLPETACGFSLVELLVALTVCALLSGAIAAVTPQARSAFEATPEALDLQQRERTLIDVLTRAVRSAAWLAVTHDQGDAGDRGPAIELLEPDEAGQVFHSMRVIAIAGPGRGVLASDQVAPADALVLRPDAFCPVVADVCGFVPGAIAAVVNREGRTDLFAIASVNPGATSIRPSSALSGSYARGSAVFAVSADWYRLAEQGDDSLALVRETAAGAVQPVVDNVLALDITRWPASGTTTRIDVSVQVGSNSTGPRRGVGTRTRRVSVALRNPS